MRAPVRRFCKRFIKKGTSRQPATARVAGESQVVPILLVSAGPSSGHLIYNLK